MHAASLQRGHATQPPPQPRQRYQDPPDYNSYPQAAPPPGGNFQTALGNRTKLPHDPTNPRDVEHENYKAEQAKRIGLQSSMEQARQNPGDARNGPNSQLDNLQRQRESALNEANMRYAWSGQHAAGDGHQGVVDQADQRMAQVHGLNQRIHMAQMNVDHAQHPEEEEMEEYPEGEDPDHMNSGHGEDEEGSSQADMGQRGISHEWYQGHGGMRDDDEEYGDEEEEGQHGGGNDEDLFGTGHPHQQGLDDFHDPGVH